jgi:glutamine synthetase
MVSLRAIFNGMAPVTTDAQAASLAKQLKKQGVGYIRFEMADLMGLPRSKTVPVDAFSRFATKGVNMYGGTLGLDSGSNVVPQTGLAEEKGFMDAFLIPDLATLRRLPWDPQMASVICTPHWGLSREKMVQAPRNLLQTQIDRARDMGFSVISGHELEFYLLEAESHAPLFGGHHIFHTGRNHYSPFITELMGQLTALGIELTTHNAEFAPSQFELNFAPAEGIAGADTAYRFKSAVKEFAHRQGLLASFMSKPQADRAGCGYHLHLGLTGADGTNSFNDSAAPHGLSLTARQFTAGIAAHARSLTALMAPTINCYHRFVRGSFAPSRVTWGVEDRTALLRMKASRDKSTHLEVRGGAGMANPYLLQAGLLAAGLSGIARNLPLEEPPPGLAEDDSDAPLLPNSLEEALTLLEVDSVLCEALGESFVRLFCTVKRFEIDRWRRHISDWERAEYLELY